MKIVDRPSFLASTICSLFAGEIRTKTTLTMDVASSPDILVPCNNPAFPVRLVEELRHKTGRSGFHSQYGPWKFSTDLIVLSACSRTGVHSASNGNGYNGIYFPGGKLWPACRADSSAVLVVPNVKVRTEAQHSFRSSESSWLVRETFTFI